MNDEITQLLRQWSGGDEQALEDLTPLVYGELKQLADRLMGAERPGHTLQPTALVNELYERLPDVNLTWSDRNHFYALSARIMRRILVAHARSRDAQKRGGKNSVEITLHDNLASSADDIDIEILTLDQAINELADLSERQAEMLEMHYFGGLTYAELAEVLNVAESTVHRDLRVAKAWMKTRLQP